ncbi:hypothetical protein BGZ95_006661 [Linnemannia exigua]|uniref:Uncharacterized protein n=1 Tax=Linnemannia exigua TaxID=604196 RepID=A0AAD4D146_9FUNG|nr:hypothetical protein BGZ95_006661 [Linnemannia exigua]
MESRILLYNRCRFAIKTRSQLKKHAPPEALKQYQLKPWKSPPESPLDTSIDTSPSKAKPKQQRRLREVATMNKKDLVDEMQWDFPTRTLDIGTINANVSRALSSEINQTTASTYRTAIRRVLRDVTRISSRVKRTAQRAIALYIERLSDNNIDENDGSIINTANTTITSDNTSTSDTIDITNTTDITDTTDTINPTDISDTTDTINPIDDTNTTNSTNTTNTINTTNSTDITDAKKLDAIDRRLLDVLCPGFSNKDLVDSAKERTEQEPDKPDGLEEHDDSLDKKNEALSFLMSLLTAIHSTKLPKKTGMGLHVRSFIERAQDFLPVFIEGKSTEYYSGSSFLRSAALQLSVELKKHYRNGSIDLCNKIKVLKDKKLLKPEARGHINPQRSAIENFILLNKACGNAWVLMPMSTFDVKFITLSELDLTKIFWQELPLRQKLQSYAHPDFPSIEYSDQVTQSDIGLWLSTTTPGFLITRLLTDICRYSADQRKKLRNYSRSTFLMPVEEMRSHIQSIRNDNFEPASYTGKGYVLRGSIRTDGFRLQVLAFKLNELHSVKYRRLPAEKLPCRLTSTIGGTDYFLTEIRNVVSTKQDVIRLLNCDPKSIKILGIDLGQAFVVGASAILPLREQPSVEQRQEPDVTMKSLLLDVEEADEIGEAKESSPKFFNLAVKQKAVYQPTFKHRRWLEQRKERAAEGSVSISHIETSLPSRRGPEASISNYTQREREVEAELDSFYGNVVLKKHKWNAQKARAEEYILIADRLLQLVGGSTGAKRDEDNKVVICVGLGQFSSKIRLSSLHESFQSYFVQKMGM